MGCVKSQFRIATAAKAGGDVVNIQTLRGTTLQAVENRFDCRQGDACRAKPRRPAIPRAGLDGSPVRAGLRHCVPQCGEQALCMRSAIWISVLSGHETATSEAAKLPLGI